MTLYPVMLNISSRKVVVIGGGSVALRKVEDLVRCGALVTVIAPELHETIAAMHAADPERVHVLERAYRHGDLEGAHIVFAASGDERVNHEVFLEANEKKIFINAVDDPGNCSFFVPSWFTRDGLVISVSTSGISPSLAAKIRRDIEKVIPDSIEHILTALQAARKTLREEKFKKLSSSERGRILKKIVDNDDLLHELVRSYNADSVDTFIRKIIVNDPKEIS